MLKPFKVKGGRTDYTDKRRRADDSPASRATENVSGMRSIRVRMRQSDEDTAAKILNIARNAYNASRMVQRITTVIKNRKTVNSIFSKFASCSVCQRSGPKKNFIAIRSSSGAPTLENCFQNADKFMKKTYARKRTTEAQRTSPFRKIGKEGQEVCSKGGKQVLLMHIAFS